MVYLFSLFLFSATIILSTLSTAHASGVLFASLPRTIDVQANINGRDVREGGLTAKYLKDNITISWSFNTSSNASDAAYKKVVVRLCYGAKSAILRKWRKNTPDLSKSKTCYRTIKAMPYYATGNTTMYTPSKNIPGAFYFIRLFVLNSSDDSATPAKNSIAFGQTTDANRTRNLFEVIPYKGTSAGIYISVAIFSAISYTLLFGLFFRERFLKKTE